MAYKNQKKNKKHSAEIRKSNAARKSAKKKQRHDRAHPIKQMSMAEMEYLISKM